MKISVVIPTFNRVDSLSRTIAFLEQSNLFPDEIIVVDQTQDKQLASEIANKCNNTQLNAKYRWISKPSLTKARNVGYELSTGDVIVFMDDDVDVRPDTFANIHELFSDKNLAMAGGVNEKDDLAHQSFLGIMFGKSSFFRRNIGHVTFSVYGRFPLHVEKETPSEWAMGFFFVVRKSIMDKYNIRFDENLKYYAYAEDLDFTYRYYRKAKALNYRCIFSSMLTVRHNVSIEYRIPSRSQTYMGILHRRYLRKKLMPGFISYVLTIWSEIGVIAFRVMHKESIWDNLNAHLFYLRNRKDIINGKFHYDVFME